MVISKLHFDGGFEYRSRSSKIMVPKDKAAMDKFEMEDAGEEAVVLSKGYNGSLTSKEAGSIGGRW